MVLVAAAFAVASEFVAAPFVRATIVGRRPPSGPLVYSDRIDDPWNRIFSLLFTRTVRTRMTDDFPESGPFTVLQPGGVPRPMRISTRVFERREDGDRAIDAFYPAFLTSAGLRHALAPAGEQELTRSLSEALSDRATRSPLARALMQADLWSAFDVLMEIPQDSGTRSTELLELWDR